jgi:hypothetical protein
MMGYPMALNIRRKLPSTSKLYVFDVVESALEKFKEESASHGEVIICSSSKEVTDNADTVISMLPEGSHVRAAYLTPKTGCIATSSKSKKLFLDCSTIDAKTSIEVGEEIEKSGIGEFSDTPVSVWSENIIIDIRAVPEVHKMALWLSCLVLQSPEFQGSFLSSLSWVLKNVFSILVQQELVSVPNSPTIMSLEQLPLLFLKL